MDDFPLGWEGGSLLAPLVGFYQEPADAASACIAVVDSPGDPANILPRYRSVGAPVVLALHDDRVQWWAQGVREPRLIETIAEGDLLQFFSRNQEGLRPEVVYRAKTRGLFEPGYQLSFVDAALMPLLEAEMGRKLSELVERATEVATAELGSTRISSVLLQSVFWLLAAKILRDKQVPGFAQLDLRDIEPVLSQVASHYGAKDRGSKASRSARSALEAAAEVLAQFSPLGHVTPEALASVYENSLVSKETRAKLGIHSTPSFLTRYVVWRLAPWIEGIPVEQRHVFEPTCGQGAFLVAAMRLLRDLLPQDTDKEARKAYLREHLHGDDLDSFAIELARLSLTLADIPNPDGWDLKTTNIFSGSELEQRARNSMIVLANPPFEVFKEEERKHLAQGGVEVRPASKAFELLRRVLPKLRPGAIFGVVVPQGFLHSRTTIDVRSFLLDNFELAEITLLPDGVFNFSDAESAVLLGRRTASKVGRAGCRYRRVRESRLDLFRSSYAVSQEQRVSADRFLGRKDRSFFVPDLEEVWEELAGAHRLEDLAEIGKGLEFESSVPPSTETSSSKPFPDSSPGFLRIGRDLQLHSLPSELWFNLDPVAIRRPGSGSVTGEQQVLVNYAPVSRGPWRLKALLDPSGHAVSSTFLTVRTQRTDLPLLYLWSLLNSPLANAFAYTHSTKRHNLKGTLANLPVPNASSVATKRVAAAAQRYLSAVSKLASGPLFTPVEPESACDLLLAVDAEVLRLYDLPPRLERSLLDLFAGSKRLGVPFHFDRYFPEGFSPWVPLHSYLSPDYQRSTAGNLRRQTGPVPESMVAALRAAVEAFES